jgi:AcrR family transcriptional regulator
VRRGERGSGGGLAVPIREAVLDAALATFTEHTYGGTSMALVAERAGVAVGSIYRHFPSKEALGNAVYLRWKGRLLERVEREVDPAAPARDAFGQLWRAFAGFAGDHPEAFAFLEYQQHEGYLDVDSRAVTDRLTVIAADLLVRGQRDGAVRSTDPAVLIGLTYGAFVGLVKAVGAGAVASEQAAAAEAAVWAMLRS